MIVAANVEGASLLLALLAFLALALAIGIALLAVGGQLHRLTPVQDLLLPVAFAIALTATMGSLYYSNIADFTPCRLCWWQRIFMYPLVPILGIGTLRRTTDAAWYGLPLTLGGLGYAMYHTQLRWWPEQGSTCEAEAACTSVWVNTFGFVSIPFMAACGFIAILALLATQLRLSHHSRH